jgi:hypothetical protein
VWCCGLIESLTALELIDITPSYEVLTIVGPLALLFHRDLPTTDLTHRIIPLPYTPPLPLPLVETHTEPLRSTTHTHHQHHSQQPDQTMSTTENTHEVEVTALFSAIDANANGTLDLGELRRLFGPNA